MSAISSNRNEALLLLVLAGIQFTYVLDFSIMMPLGPLLMRALAIDTRQFGLLLSSYSVAAAVSGMLAAGYIDRFGRRRLMLCLYALFALATLCCALAPGYVSLLLARALAGIFGGVIAALVQTMVADAIPFERRGKAMGTIMAALSLATVAGIPIGLLLAQSLPTLDWRAPFLLITLLTLAIFATAYRILPPMNRHVGQSGPEPLVRQLLALVSARNVQIAFGFTTLIVMSGFMMFPYVAIYLTSNAGLPDSFISLMYLCGGAASFFTGRIIGALADKYGKQRIFTWATLISFFPLAYIPQMGRVPQWLALTVVTAFFILITGRMVPGMAALSAIAPTATRGTFLSLISSLQMLMIGVAALVGGWIVSHGPNGELLNYEITGYLGVLCGCAAIGLMWLIDTRNADK